MSGTARSYTTAYGAKSEICTRIALVPSFQQTTGLLLYLSGFWLILISLPKGTKTAEALRKGICWMLA